ncbi:MAG: MBL fold metallo-hydrolase [Lentisphaerae bacterium]|nr:MBL fold metallo-hydrolase [Lentisphaerota bacterium]MCP4099975.1 MBL fold metallo-hydrolase [Lentisphaerota bacterium]
MKLIALIENTRLNDRPDLAVERGLSLYASTMGKKILFDTGGSKAFCDNAELLNINIQNVDAAVISHRHHDHCNGIGHFLERNSKAIVYFRYCERKDYFFKGFGFTNNVGINKDLFNEFQNRFVFINTCTKIYPNVYIVTDLSQRYAQPKGNRYLFSKNGNDCKLDTFDHELFMIVKEEDGLILFSGCGHNGILNMVETAVELFPNTQIKAVVGGFHLVGLPLFRGISCTKKDIEFIGEKLLYYPINKVYTGHCTGMKAYGILKKILGERIEYFPTGSSVYI